MGYIKFVRKRTCKVSKSGPQTKGFALSLPSMLFVHIINVFWKNVKSLSPEFWDYRHGPPRPAHLCYASIKTAPTLELDGSDFCERTIHWLTECLAAYTSVAKIKRNPNFSNGIAGMTDTLQIP